VLRVNSIAIRSHLGFRVATSSYLADTCLVAERQAHPHISHIAGRIWNNKARVVMVMSCPMPVGLRRLREQK